MSQDMDSHTAPSTENIGQDDMPAPTLPTATPNASPFLLKTQDVETLTQSEGFGILRSHLADHYTFE